ncbi:MAG: hypothetical protein EP146_16965 [Oscillibacter sp.]|uniref:hypothetical protein n=1 Tax=Oscillibacter sp. TaxID=1945593 RepID=UPI00132CBD1B|nr:hypothetical protein [Oscillibacter sp.]MUU12902.1 hypothetical protein [Oscillibacter sp.]
MLTAGLAQTLTAELTENRAGFLDSRPELPLDPIEAPALDGFWWAEEVDGIGSPEQFAVLRQGKQVLTLWYTGSADLRTETAYLTLCWRNDTPPRQEIPRRLIHCSPGRGPRDGCL